MSNTTHIVKITDAAFDDMACGSCGSVILGYDEFICPVCAAHIDFDHEVSKTQAEIEAIAAKAAL